MIRDDGSIEYVPAPGYAGADSFEYTICDSGGACETAVVDIMVNSSPSVLTLELTTVVGQPLGPLTSLDPEFDSYDLTIVGGSLPDGVTMLRDGTFTGIPTEGGTFTFTVRACDENGACADFVVTVEVSVPTNTQTTTTPTRRLAITGSGATTIVTFAGAVLALGVALLLAASRRRRTA